MKIIWILFVMASTVLTSTGSAANYKELVKEGYRWAAADGPFACPAKGDVSEVIKHSGDGQSLQMVEQLRAYFLVQRYIDFLVVRICLSVWV